MKKLFYLIFLISFAACQSGVKPKTEEKAVTDSLQIVKTTINVGGMHCDMCVTSIEKGINELDGIVNVVVSLNDSNAVVSFDKSKVNQQQIEKAIEGRGYSIKPSM